MGLISRVSSRTYRKKKLKENMMLRSTIIRRGWQPVIFDGFKLRSACGSVRNIQFKDSFWFAFSRRFRNVWTNYSIGLFMGPYIWFWHILPYINYQYFYVMNAGKQFRDIPAVKEAMSEAELAPKYPYKYRI